MRRISAFPRLRMSLTCYSENAGVRWILSILWRECYNSSILRLRVPRGFSMFNQTLGSRVK